MKNLKTLLISLMFQALFLSVSCESPYMVKHPVSTGDTYYLYATFYGDEFEGKQTADGSVFSGNELTCAARGFPFGTALEIQSLETGKRVVVTVNDRPGKNVIDLTKKAFGEIDNIDKGRIKTKVQVVKKIEKTEEKVEKKEVIDPAPEKEKVNSEKVKPEPAKTGEKFFSIQVAAFSELDAAKKFQDSLTVETYIFAVTGSKDIYRVRYGRFPTKEEGESCKTLNFSGTEAIVVEVTE